MRLQAGNNIDIPDWDYLREPSAEDELKKKARSMQRWELVLLNLASSPKGFSGTHLTIGQMGGAALIQQRYLAVVEKNCYDKRVKTTARGREYYEQMAAPIGEW